ELFERNVHLVAIGGRPAPHFDHRSIPPVGVRRARAILGSAEVERNADEPAPANPLYLPRNDLVERSKTVPVSANPLPLGAGIAIKVGDEVVGAISAGRAAGGDLENACARAGLAARQKSPLIASAAGNEHQQTKASLRCLP